MFFVLNKFYHIYDMVSYDMISYDMISYDMIAAADAAAETSETNGKATLFQEF